MQALAAKKGLIIIMMNQKMLVVLTVVKLIWIAMEIEHAALLNGVKGKLGQSLLLTLLKLPAY